MSCNINLRAYDALCTPPPDFNVPYKVFEEFFEKADLILEEAILQRLAQLGHTFCSIEERHKFYKERLALVCHTDDHPDWKRLYLMPEQILVATWWHTIQHTYNMDFDVNKVNLKGTYTFGLAPKGLYIDPMRGDMLFDFNY